MASSTRAVLDSHYCSGVEQFREHKSVKRVSFLEDDKVVIIPNNEEHESAKAFTTIPRCIPGLSRISSQYPHTSTGLARAGLNGSLKSQTQKRFLKAGDTGSLRSKEKQVKSILKKSSTQSCLRKSRFYDSFGEEYDIPSIKYNVKVDQQDKSYIKTKQNYSFYFKNNEGSAEGSHSYSDFLKRQRSGTTRSPQTSTGPYFSKANFSPTRTLVERHGNLGVVSSTSPDEPYRKSEISKLSPSLVRTCKSDAPLGVVGNMLNVSDLYPVLSNLQKNSLSSSDSSLSRHQGLGGRYIPSRELISRSGSIASHHTRNSSTQNPDSTLRFSSNSTQSNVSARASSGLGRAAELSLLHRLRRFERNDPPYVAWQASEMNIHSPNTTIPTRASGLTSIYGGSLGSRISTVRSPSSQYYY